MRNLLAPYSIHQWGQEEPERQSAPRLSSYSIMGATADFLALTVLVMACIRQAPDEPPVFPTGACLTGAALLAGSAIWCGHSARRVVRSSRGMVTGRVLASVGLLIGYALVGLIAWATIKYVL